MLAPAKVERAAVEDLVRRLVTERMGVGGEPAQFPLAVHASARHMHVSRDDLVHLFGPGYELTVERPLYQEGHFAARETVTLIGPRSRLVSNLRILGPLRARSQVELAFTDALSLGLDVPLRLSGDIGGTPGAFLMGPRGMVELKEGVIRAARHVHMSPSDAARFGVTQGDRMRLRVGGDAGLAFDQVQVRVDPSFRLEVHIDTDEANACGLHLTSDIELCRER